MKKPVRARQRAQNPRAQRQRVRQMAYPASLVPADRFQKAGDGPILVSGKELLSCDTIQTTDAMGTKIRGMLIAPTTIGPRCAVYSSLYEKYRFEKLVFHIGLNGSVLDNCAVMVAFDSDPGDDDPPYDLSGLQLMGSWRHNASVRMIDSEYHSLSVVVKQPDEGYYTSYDPAGDMRLSYAGQFYAYVIAPPGSAQVTLTVTVDYVVAFFEPQLENVVFSKSGAMAAMTAKPPTVNSWNVEPLKSMVRDIANTVKGVELVTDGTLRLLPGTYRLMQMFEPSATGTVTDHVMFQPPSLGSFGKATTTRTDMDFRWATAANDLGYRTTEYHVPTGSYATLQGLFTDGAGYTEPGSPEAVVTLDRLIF